MIKKYNLSTEGLEFKSDFNFNFELIKHLLEIRTMKGYLRIDLIYHKKSMKTYLSSRLTNFPINEAILQLEEVI
ncbi:MAG: hypothetical protein AABX04_01015 [Nanoarchaeota archaeon]